MEKIFFKVLVLTLLLGMILGVGGISPGAAATSRKKKSAKDHSNVVIGIPEAWSKKDPALQNQAVMESKNQQNWAMEISVKPYPLLEIPQESYLGEQSFEHDLIPGFGILFLYPLTQKALGTLYFSGGGHLFHLSRTMNLPTLLSHIQETQSLWVFQFPLGLNWEPSFLQWNSIQIGFESDIAPSWAASNHSSLSPSQSMKGLSFQLTQRLIWDSFFELSLTGSIEKWESRWIPASWVSFGVRK